VNVCRSPEHVKTIGRIAPDLRMAVASTENRSSVNRMAGSKIPVGPADGSVRAVFARPPRADSPIGGRLKLRQSHVSLDCSYTLVYLMFDL